MILNRPPRLRAFSLMVVPLSFSPRIYWPRAHGYLGKIIPLMLGFSKGQQLRVSRVLHFKTGVGGIKKDQISCTWTG